jgi:hypothetical protein
MAATLGQMAAIFSIKSFIESPTKYKMLHSLDARVAGSNCEQMLSIKSVSL